MTDPFAHHGHSHPSVNASIAAREKRERLSAARERAEEPDLQAAVREIVDHLITVTDAVGLIYQVVQDAESEVTLDIAKGYVGALSASAQSLREIARRLT